MKNAIAVLMLALLAAAPVAAQKVHKWVDADGNIHFGDTVPPEYAEQVFGKQEAEASQSASDKSQQVTTGVGDELRFRQEEARRKETDRVLLQTYLSVEEIESVRDGRVALLQSQDKLTQRYIDSLKRRLSDLEAQATALDSSGEDGMPVDLVDEIADTRAQITVYEDELGRSKTQQEEIQQKFAQDISRFRELKGMPAEG